MVLLIVYCFGTFALFYFIFPYDCILISFSDAGAGEANDKLWRTAQEEVLNTRRLWMIR